MALSPGDMCFPTYRQQGLLIAYGWPLVDMMNSIFSNEKTLLRLADALGAEWRMVDKVTA